MQSTEHTKIIRLLAQYDHQEAYADAAGVHAVEWVWVYDPAQGRAIPVPTVLTSYRQALAWLGY